MKTKLIAFFLIITSTVFGQVNFEKGYYIDNNNQKIDCFIKNYDWQNNPTGIEYKLTENSETVREEMLSIKEFVIPGELKFIRADVKVDRSPTDLSFLSSTRNPIWSQEVQFLKVLIEGNATLYLFQDHNLKRYFYSVSDTLIQQLIFKEYVTLNIDHNKSFGTNSDYQYQLSKDVSCKNAGGLTPEEVKYEEKSLLKYFKTYNECEASPVTEYISAKSTKKTPDNEKRETLKLKVNPGLNYTSMSFSDVNYPEHITDFGNKLTFQFGISTEYILPFNNNKWGILIEPTFQYYNSEVMNSYGAGEIHFKSIEFPFGLRHYFFLNNSLKLFVDGFLIPGIALNFNSTVTIPLGGNSIGIKEIQSTNSAAFGFGTEYKKISVEIRYYTNRDLLHDYQNYDVHYQRLAAIIGFRIL